MIHTPAGCAGVHGVSYQSASIGAPYATISAPRSVALVLKASL
ncbi:MAG TPA: hypothetical protein VGQ23_07970 [Burkholderiaceae bacterium]|nr:hypothetical protein [Burkholderiaceae bacterium]